MTNKKQSENLNSKEKKSEELEFTQDIQKEIFASILACSKIGWQDTKYVSLCMSILKPGSFTNPIIQNFFKIIKKFYDKYDDIPTPPQFSEEIKSFLNLDKNKNLPEDEYLDVLKDILKLEREANFDYSRDKIIKFAQWSAFKNALITASKKHVPKLEIDEHMEEMEKIRDMAIDFEEEDAGLKLITLSEIEVRKIEWLWHNVIPVGKITFIVGDPDVGKSFLSTFLASNVSTGKSLPCTSNRPTRKGTVLLLSAEDSPSDTIKPRINNIGGDSSKIIVIEGTLEKDSIKLFNFVEDLPRLEKTLERRTDVRLLMIDPITAYMMKVDYFKDTDVRGKVIAPLAALADKYKIAIVLIAHMTKDESKKAIYRLGGSIGLLAGARCVWLILKDDEDKTGEKRKLCCLKMNIAKKPTKAMVFRIFEPEEAKPILSFDTELVDINIEGELSGRERPIYKAEDFLKSILKHGERKSKEVEEAAIANDIKIRTLKTARARLGVISYKKGKIWYMKLSSIPVIKK